jgi:hypothetical protein
MVMDGAIEADFLTEFIREKHYLLCIFLEAHIYLTIRFYLEAIFR